MCLFIIHRLFTDSRSKHGFYRGIECMKKFCVDLRKHATEIIIYEKKEILQMRDEEIILIII